MWVWFAHMCCVCLCGLHVCICVCVCLALGHKFPHLLGEPAGQLGAGLFLFVVWGGGCGCQA